MKNARKSPWRILYKFHRYSGLLVALIVIILAVTGLLLNHTDELKLDKRFISSPTLLSWYGIKAPDSAISYQTSEHKISQLENQIYFDQQFILKHSSSLLGAVENDSFIVLAFEDTLMLLTKKGELMEIIPKQVNLIGISSNNTIYIKQGENILFSNDDLLTWNINQGGLPSWSEISTQSDLTLQAINHNYLANIIPYERILLDIHSGRFFGPYGVLLIDIAGVLTLLLAITGCWIWLRHILKKNPLK